MTAFLPASFRISPTSPKHFRQFPEPQWLHRNPKLWAKQSERPIAAVTLQSAQPFWFPFRAGRLVEKAPYFERPCWSEEN
jgi:hypothetical protein